MADISIEQEKATQWIADVKSELELVEALLKKVATVSTTVAGDDDVIMQGIENTFQTLSNFWDNMCDGFKSATDYLSQGIKMIGQAASEVVDDINTVKSKIGN